MPVAVARRLSPSGTVLGLGLVLLCGFLGWRTYEDLSDPERTQVRRSIRLLNASNDLETRREAAASLYSVRPPELPAAVAALLQALRDPDAGVRRGAALSIGPAIRDAWPAEAPDHAQFVNRVTPSLVAALGDADPCVVVAAATSLRSLEIRGESHCAGRLGPDRSIVVPALERRLDDDEPAVREESARALGLIADPAGLAPEALLRVLRSDPDHRVRLAAVEALGRPSWQNRALVVLHLIPRLSDPAADVRRLAARYLRAPGHLGWMVHGYTGEYSSNDQLDRPGPAGLAGALVGWRMSQQGGPPPDLETLYTTARGCLTRPTPDSLAACFALAHWMPDAPATRELLTELGDTLTPETDYTTVMQILDVLRAFGPSAQVAAGSVRALSHHPDASVRSHAAQTVAAIDPETGRDTD